MAFNDITIFNLLVKYNVNLGIRDNDKNTLLYVVSNYNINYDESEEIYNRLLEDIDINSMNKMGETVLYKIVTDSNLSPDNSNLSSDDSRLLENYKSRIVKILLDKEADYNITYWERSIDDVPRLTILHVILQYCRNSTEITDLLFHLSWHIDLNMKDSNGNTILHLLFNDNEKILKSIDDPNSVIDFILTYDGDPNIFNNKVRIVDENGAIISNDEEVDEKKHTTVLSLVNKSNIPNIKIPFSIYLDKIDRDIPKYMDDRDGDHAMKGLIKSYLLN